MKMITAIDSTPLSALTFGTMQFGGSADVVASQEMWEAAREAGVTHFDTAWSYTEGQSEHLTGRFAARERDSLVIATKVGYVGGAGRENMLSQLETSRQRLGMDVVDILYLHRFDSNTDLRETLETFAELKSAGRIRFVGLSNFAAWQVMKAQWIGSEFGLGVDIIQPMYNLVKRQAEVELFPMCLDQNIVVAPYSPLGGGLLTGKYARGDSGRLTEDDRYATRYGETWMRETAAALAELAERRGIAPGTLAVAWAMAHPARPHPIISARNVAQLRPSLDALDVPMTAELYASISALSRTPPPASDRLEEQT